MSAPVVVVCDADPDTGERLPDVPPGTALVDAERAVAFVRAQQPRTVVVALDTDALADQPLLARLRAVAPEAGPHKARSALAIPRRSRTRAAERAWRIQAERDDNHIVNAAYDAELERALGPGSGVPTSARAAAPRPTGSPYSELIPDEPPPF